MNNSEGSAGILEGLKRKKQISKEEVKNNTSFIEKKFTSLSTDPNPTTKRSGTKKERYSRIDGAGFELKRSYILSVSTNKKLQKLKMDDDDSSITFNELVDEAIDLLYQQRGN